MRSTFRPEVVGDIGGFGGLFAFEPKRFDHPLLVSSTDGVGTKSLIARLTGRYDTIGIDLVAMSVDDIAVQGAEPLFFLDYISIGKLVPEIVDDIVGGVAHGCVQAGLRAARRRDVRAPRPHGARRVRPRRLRGRRGRARSGAPQQREARRRDRRLRQPRPALQRLLARPPRAARPRRASPRRSRVEGRTPLARRRADPPERDLRARDAEAARTRRGARVRAHHRRRPARQPRARAPVALRRRAAPRRVGGTADLRRDPGGGRRLRRRDGARLQPRPRDAGGRRVRETSTLRSTPCARQATKPGSSERCQKAAVG